MRVSIVILALASVAHAALPYKEISDKGSIEVGGLQGPITLKVSNPDGWIEIVHGRPGASTLKASVQDIHNTYQGRPVQLYVEKFKMARSHDADKVLVMVRYPGAQHKRSVDEYSPFSRLQIEIPESLLGHLQIRTESAFIEIDGFRRPPVPGFERVVDIRTRGRTRGAFRQIQGLKIGSYENMLRCHEIMVENGIDLIGLFSFFPSY